MYLLLPLFGDDQKQDTQSIIEPSTPMVSWRPRASRKRTQLGNKTEVIRKMNEWVKKALIIPKKKKKPRPPASKKKDWNQKKRFRSGSTTVKKITRMTEREQINWLKIITGLLICAVIPASLPRRSKAPGAWPFIWPPPTGNRSSCTNKHIKMLLANPILFANCGTIKPYRANRVA